MDAIQVRKFDWIDGGEHQRYGMVAQELGTVAPEGKSVPDDAEEMQSVDYSKLVPMLVKEIQSLRARVAQLGRRKVMATWSIIANLERQADGGVIAAHWRCDDSETVADETYTASSYGTCSFTPDASAEDFIAYNDLPKQLLLSG